MAITKLTYYNRYNLDLIGTDLTPLWDWTGVVAAQENTDFTFYIDAAKTMGIRFGKYGTFDGYFGLVKNGTLYANYAFSISDNGIRTLYEKTNNALIISITQAQSAGDVSANNCYKIIICYGKNKNNQEEPIAIRINSIASGNTSTLIASDVNVPTALSEQNGNANVSSKYTALINLYNTKSNFVATDVYKSMFMELSAWSFGDVMLNGHHYRMSGPIFALDE